MALCTKEVLVRPVLDAFTDAVWGSNIDDLRSAPGVMVMIGNAPVVFKSKYQRTVALSCAARRKGNNQGILRRYEASTGEHADQGTGDKDIQVPT